MQLDEKYFRPFDLTYISITADIEAEARELLDPGASWLRRLVVTFKDERLKWNSTSGLNGYRFRWACFNTWLMRLVAGAYLHIAYDLPRALADDWPGGPGWPAGPTKIQGQTIYFKLAKIFPERLVHSARSVRIVGLAAILSRTATRKTLRSAGIWVSALRQGAWLHAEILATQPGRQLREARMADAITAALEDASLFYPGSILQLTPPDSAIYSSPGLTLAIFLQIFEIILEYISLIGLGMAGAHFWRERYRYKDLDDFVHFWGRITEEYVSFAVREPESFGAYRTRRRVEMSFAPGEPKPS